MKKSFIISIAGRSGSGKTSLANALQSEIGSDKSLIFPIDAYYRDLSHVPLEKRDNVNFDHLNALDLKGFIGYLSWTNKVMLELDYQRFL